MISGDEQKRLRLDPDYEAPAGLAPTGPLFQSGNDMGLRQGGENPFNFRFGLGHQLGQGGGVQFGGSSECK